MDSFRWIAVALSMILGLGVTRLLSAFVAVFRSRKHSKLDWIPLAWAGCIFLWQLQFWWAIIELPGLIRVWNARFLSDACLPYPAAVRLGGTGPSLHRTGGEGQSQRLF